MCFECRSLGYFKSDCPKNKGAESGQAGHVPGVCPQCRKGNHWARVCKSKSNILGCPLPGNLQAPKYPQQAAYGAMKLLPSQLVRATPRHAGLDLCSTTHTVLTPEMGVQTLPRGVFGPLLAETCGFLLGQSGSIVKGRQIFPGVIDNDYEGEIKIMAALPHGVITVPAHQRIAQLVLTSFHLLPSRFVKNERGQGGFDSAGVHWVQSITNQRPNLKLTFEGKSLKD
jgi:dUTPase